MVYGSLYRNPSPSARPTFKDILCVLISDEETLLTMPYEDAATHSEACCLGAPLIAGYKMYPDLQTRYLSMAMPEKPSEEEDIYEQPI